MCPFWRTSMPFSPTSRAQGKNFSFWGRMDQAIPSLLHSHTNTRGLIAARGGAGSAFIQGPQGMWISWGYRHICSETTTLETKAHRARLRPSLHRNKGHLCPKYNWPGSFCSTQTSSRQVVFFVCLLFLQSFIETCTSRWQQFSVWKTVTKKKKKGTWTQVYEINTGPQQACSCLSQQEQRV
jgi:hypothetical protein